MSATHTSEYVAMARFPIGHQVLELPSMRTVDYFISRSAAEYAARLLNTGLASVEPHAIVGCKVVAS